MNDQLAVRFIEEIDFDYATAVLLTAPVQSAVKTWTENSGLKFPVLFPGQSSSQGIIQVFASILPAQCYRVLPGFQAPMHAESCPVVSASMSAGSGPKPGNFKPRFSDQF
jgi:hypothetical protein